MLIKASWVRKQSAGSERMAEISTAIKEGALAFPQTLSTVCYSFSLLLPLQPYSEFQLLLKQPVG